MNFRLKNSGSIPDKDRDLQFLLNVHAVINHPGLEALSFDIIWPMCNNDNSALFAALIPSGRCFRLNTGTALPFQYTFSEILSSRALSTVRSF